MKINNNNEKHIYAYTEAGSTDDAAENLKTCDMKHTHTHIFLLLFSLAMMNADIECLCGGTQKHKFATTKKTMGEENMCVGVLRDVRSGDLRVWIICRW